LSKKRWQQSAAPGTCPTAWPPNPKTSALAGVAESKAPWKLVPKKNADVVEHPEVFHHVGVLVNGLPGSAELPFI
jgi:hypothetical protein